jgi:hypothetical protein
MKLFQLVVLFVIVAAILAGASAPAVGGDSKSTVIQLTPTGAEPTAWGKATLSNLKITWSRGNWGVSYQGRLKVQCAGLTPGAVYEVRTNQFGPNGWVMWDFQASGSGSGTAGGSIQWSGMTSPLSVAVVRIDETPEGTVDTVVLTGSFPF